MTKAIVSACLLQLLSDEKINLQDTLDHYFDNYSNCYALIENAKNVTEIEKTKAPSIYQLLNQEKSENDLLSFSLLSSSEIISFGLDSICFCVY